LLGHTKGASEPSADLTFLHTDECKHRRQRETSGRKKRRQPSFGGARSLKKKLTLSGAKVMEKRKRPRGIGERIEGPLFGGDDGKRNDSTQKPPTILNTEGKVGSGGQREGKAKKGTSRRKTKKLGENRAPTKLKTKK